MVQKLRMNQWPLELFNQIELLDACAERTGSEEVLHSNACGCAVITRVVCVCVCVCVCECVCVLCSGCADSFAQHIHMHQIV